MSKMNTTLIKKDPRKETILATYNRSSYDMENSISTVFGGDLSNSIIPLTVHRRTERMP